jgi:hypothetical protein
MKAIRPATRSVGAGNVDVVVHRLDSESSRAMLKIKRGILKKLVIRMQKGVQS